MNLDLLIKLVKLANNNPNENEANLAARKVCKLIEEGKYQFSPNSVVNKSPQRPGSQPVSNPYSNPGYGSPFEEFFRQGGFKNMWQESERQRDFHNEQYKRSQQEQRPRQDAHNYGYDFYSKPEEPRKKPSRNRECSKCGYAVNTSNMKDPFVCSVCQWKDYQEKEKQNGY
jgi:ribosomal protein S27AE